MTYTMAAVLRSCRKPLKVERLKVPAPARGQVLVRVRFAGLCRSQLNEIQGLKGSDPYLPHTLGHEGSGTVEAVGPGVKKVRRGDRVVMTWIKASGLEGGPVNYEDDRGAVVHSGSVSTLMERAMVSENRLVKIPAFVPLRQAALLGCAVLTGAGIVFHSLRVRRGQSLAVFGAGGVGLSVIVAARLAGADPIIAVDVSNAKLSKALSMGATHGVRAGGANTLRKILDWTKKKGVDHAVESAGSRCAAEDAFSAVREKGGLCVIAGNLPHGQKISIDPFELIRGKKIAGTWGGESDPDRDIPRYIRYFGQGRWNLGAMIAADHPLKGINAAFAEFLKGKPGRTLICMGERS